jgi:hypothetical protein
VIHTARQESRAALNHILREAIVATLRVIVVNASGKPLPDDYDATVIVLQTGTIAAQFRGHQGSKVLTIPNLVANTVYRVQVFPVRHRPVERFVTTGGGAKATGTSLVAPIHPDRATPVFPAFANLPPELQTVLDRSALESGAPPMPPGPGAGAAVYNGLVDLQKAGLLNLFAKMRHTPVAAGAAWDYVTDLYRVRGDRIFANVQVPFRDAVKTAVAGGSFEEVPEALHTPPPGFQPAKSYKTLDRYGNLQLTFFSNPTQTPPAFRVDADIDDAGGIGHAFQVLRNWLTGGETHPYDIHQILTFYQSLPPKYDLTV